MQELWSSASYEPHLLSLPFAFAPAAMSIVIAYGLVMRGEPVLRAWMLVHFVALMPYAIMMMLSPSVVSPIAADRLFRIAAAFIPMAAAAGAGFQFRLLGRHRQMRPYVWFGVAVAIAWIVIGALTDAAVAGVRRLPAGFWYADAGPYAWLALLSTVVVVTPGFVALAVVALRSKPSDERRQLRLVLIANLVTYSGLTDVALAYHIGWFPLGWLLSGIGSLLVVRALVVEDLLRARAIDTTAPRLVLHLAAAIVLGWIALGLLGAGAPWWATTVALAMTFAGVRVTLAVVGLINRGTRGGESTLDRLLGQLVSRARQLRSESEVAQLAIGVIELGLGVRVEVLVAAAEDWGWTTASGTRLDDEAAPDPLLVGWLVEQQGAIFADELDLRVPADLRALVGGLFARHRARAIIAVVSRDELLALVLVPELARRQRARGKTLAFVERAGERLGEALVHVRMAQRAAARATLAREVELAATVQAQLLPGKEPHVLGDLTVVGSWLPATRCAGDFWGVYPLGDDGRVLVAIGDVTGHGVASATVTAAASAACDVVVHREGSTLALGDLVVALDAAVRRVGGGELTMTCFAAIIDPPMREIRFVSCGHTTPYLCRIGERDVDGRDLGPAGSAAEGRRGIADGRDLGPAGSAAEGRRGIVDGRDLGPAGSAAEGRRGVVELHALVGRGNPLGGVGAVVPKVQQRPLRAGDLVVWYTDGVIEAQDPAGEPFGDRRLQRMLRRLDRAQLTPPGVHDFVHAAVGAHRAGRLRNDDETLVVAQWLPPTAASTEPAKEVAT